MHAQQYIWPITVKYHQTQSPLSLALSDFHVFEELNVAYHNPDGSDNETFVTYHAGVHASQKPEDMEDDAESDEGDDGNDTVHDFDSFGD